MIDCFNFLYAERPTSKISKNIEVIMSGYVQSNQDSKSVFFRNRMSDCLGFLDAYMPFREF